MATLLVIDDNKDILSAVRLLMKGRVDEVVTSPTPDAIPELLRRHRPQVVLLDMNFRATVNTGNEGLYWLREIRRLSPQTAVVLFTAYADVALAVEGMKLGAVDFVTKPFDNDALVASLKAAFGDKGKPKAAPASQMLWGDSPAMTALRRIAERVAATNANILITGENGTGKDLLAREIHRMSARSTGPMEAVDMGAVTETLFESELYGHVRGAFTDAKADRAGKFETAHGGTLFLDEIGNLPYRLQAKLLTALQSRSIVRVGSNTPIPVDIRLISATNRDLDRMVADGGFREDLLYRINTIHIELPSLAERTEDIVPLAEIFLKRYATKYNKPCTGFDPQAREKLTSHTWPGNIRELQHTVEKAVIMADTESVTADELLISRREGEEPGPRPATFSTLEEMERSMVTEALKRHEGNLSAVAAQLGVTRQTLYNKLKKYNL